MDASRSREGGICANGTGTQIRGVQGLGNAEGHERTGDVGGHDDLGLTVRRQVASEEATRVVPVGEGQESGRSRLGSHGHKACARNTVEER